MQILFRFQPYFLAFYLLFLGISLGAILASGAFSAPVIFRVAHFIPDLNITLLESGILMTQIFIKLNYLLNALAIVILVFEILALRVNGAKLTPILGFISVILILLFTLYYTPYMLEAQNLGESGIANATFDSMHTQSVYVFKALMASLCLLFIIRAYKGR